MQQKFKSGVFFRWSKFTQVVRHIYIDNLAKHAEEAAAQGNMRELYNTTKKFSAVAGYPLTDKPTVEEQGKR